MTTEVKKSNDALMSIETRLCKIEEALIGSKEVLTFDEASEYTGISKSFLYKMTSTGSIPCYKPSGKLLFFNKAELNNWMLTNRKATKDELETKANTMLALKGGSK